MVLAFLVPWLPLLMFAYEDAQLYVNRSFKLGLLTGVACNLSLGLIRYAAFEDL
jgi:hypothetical protein